MPCSTICSIEGAFFLFHNVAIFQSSRKLAQIHTLFIYLFIQKDHVSYGFRDLLVENSGIVK